MNFKKLMESNKKFFDHQILQNVLNKEIFEEPIPGTSARLFFSDYPLFIYLKHHSILIPSIYLLIKFPSIVPILEQTAHDNSVIIPMSGFNYKLEIGMIAVVKRVGQIIGIGKSIKSNKKSAIEIVFKVNDHINQYLITKYKNLINLTEGLMQFIDRINESSTDCIEVQDEVSCSPIDPKVDMKIEAESNLENLKISDSTHLKIAILALKSINIKDLPLEPSAFKNVLIKHKGSANVDLASTSYKTMTRFIEYLQSKEMLTFKLHPYHKRKLITDIHHESLRRPSISSSSSASLEPPEEPMEKINIIAESIEELYSLPICFCEMLYKLNLLYDYQTLYSLDKALGIPKQYLRVFTESEDNYVIIDAILSRALGVDAARIPKEDFYKLIRLMLIPKYFIKNNLNNEKFRVAKNIIFITVNEESIKVNKFKGNKFVVAITGFDFYQIDPIELDERIKKLGYAVTKCNRNLIKYVGKLNENLIRVFTKDFGVPIKFIKISKGH